jgi:hypothetical protein
MGTWHKRLGVGAAGACIALAGVLPASAITATGWHIAYTAQSNSDPVSGVTAPAANDAWAFGYHRSGETFISTYYLHWNGHRWRTATVPQPAGFAAFQIASSSPDNVWIVGNTPTGYAALVYNGSAWTTMAVPYDGALTVLASNDVWVMSGAGCQQSGSTWSCSTGLDHWDGTTWTSSTLPVYGLNLAGAGQHLWLIAATPVTYGGPGEETGSEALFRWSGSQWLAAAAPDGAIVGDIPAAAAPDGRLWLIAESNPTGPAHLDYWNGTSWSKPKGHFDGGGGLTYDGHNGFWLGQSHWTGTRWINTLPPGNHAPVYGVGDTAQVPGSASIWGIAFRQNSIRTVIAAHGQLP